MRALALRSLARRLPLASVGALSMRGATMVLSVLSVTLAAPFLGPGDLGRYAVLQSLVAWIAIATLGLPDACSGILGKFHRGHRLDTAHRYLDSATKAVGATALGLAALTGLGSAIALLGDWTTAAHLLPVAASVLLALGATPFMLIQASLNADGEIARSTGWAMAMSALSVTAIWLVVDVLQAPPEQRLLAVVLCSGVANLLVRIVMYVVESRRIYGSTVAAGQVSMRRMKALLVSGYPFIVINVASLAAFQIDRFVAYRALSPADAARLDVTMKVLIAVYTLYNVLIARLWHSVGRAWNSGDLAGARAALLNALARGVMFWVVTGVLLVPELDRTVQFLTRGTVRIDDLWFAVAAVLFVAVRGLTDAVSISLFASRQQHRTIRTVIAHGVLNVPASILGCLAFGLPGIMVGQLLSLLMTSGWTFPLLFWRATAAKK